MTEDLDTDSNPSNLEEGAIMDIVNDFCSKLLCATKHDTAEQFTLAVLSTSTQK